MSTRGARFNSHAGCLGACLLLFAACDEKQPAGRRIARLKLHVVDEDGKAIAGAKAGASFELPRHGTGKNLSSKSAETDQDGNASFSEDTVNGYVIYGATKEGYYGTVNEKFQFKSTKAGKWEPENGEEDVVLKRIVNPITMNAMH